MRKTSGSTVTRYLWDGDDLVAEINGAGALIREYSYYPGVDRPHSVRRSSDGAVFYYVTELPGHIVNLVDVANVVVNTHQFTPWGEPITTSEQVAQPLRFAGREFDACGGECGASCLPARRSRGDSVTGSHGRPCGITLSSPDSIV